MNKFLRHYSHENFGIDTSVVDEYDILLGAADLEEKVSDVKDALDLLDIPPKPSKEELMIYRKQILERIRYLEYQLHQLPPGIQRKNLQRKINKLKGGSKNIITTDNPIAWALFLGGVITAATPIFAQSYFRRDIESPAQLLAGQKLEIWDDHGDDELSAIPTYSTLIHRYPKFYVLEFLLASGIFHKWITTGLRKEEERE